MYGRVCTATCAKNQSLIESACVFYLLPSSASNLVCFQFSLLPIFRHREKSCRFKPTRVYLALVVWKVAAGVAVAISEVRQSVRAMPLRPGRSRGKKKRQGFGPYSGGRCVQCCRTPGDPGMYRTAPSRPGAPAPPKNVKREFIGVSAFVRTAQERLAGV